MRFAQTACKFEGLRFGHQFFYELMYLWVAISVNVAKKGIKKIVKKVSARLHVYLRLESMNHQKIGEIIKALQICKQSTQTASL